VRLCGYIMCFDISTAAGMQIRVRVERLRATIVVLMMRLAVGVLVECGDSGQIEGSTKEHGIGLGEMEHRSVRKYELQFIDLAMPSLER
jgi:hypothetical protein